MDPLPKRDLSLSTTDELVDELKARHSACLIVVVQRGETGDQQDTISCAYEGGWATCIGLATYAQRRLLDEVCSE